MTSVVNRNSLHISNSAAFFSAVIAKLEPILLLLHGLTTYKLVSQYGRSLLVSMSNVLRDTVPTGSPASSATRVRGSFSLLILSRNKFTTSCSVISGYRYDHSSYIQAARTGITSWRSPKYLISTYTPFFHDKFILPRHTNGANHRCTFL